MLVLLCAFTAWTGRALLVILGQKNLGCKILFACPVEQWLCIPLDFSLFLVNKLIQILYQ